MKEDESRIAQNENNNPLNIKCPYPGCQTPLENYDITKLNPLPHYQNILRMYIQCDSCKKKVIVLYLNDIKGPQTHTDVTFRDFTRNLQIYPSRERRITRRRK